jgi:hypothetical protein
MSERRGSPPPPPPRARDFDEAHRRSPPRSRDFDDAPRHSDTTGDAPRRDSSGPEDGARRSDFSAVAARMITASLPRDDWRCSRCDYRGRASDRSCWKCGAPRGAAFGYIPPPSAPTGGGVVPVTNKAVDGARRPAGTMRAGDKRDGGGGGFREYDDDEQARRRRRLDADRQMALGRKAEKRRCAACHRFSCIC